MSRNDIDGTQRSAAKVAGLMLIFGMVLVIVANYSATFRYVVPGDVAQSARNMLAHETAFRLNLAGDLVYVLSLLVLLSSLYLVLKPVQKHIALVSAACWLVLAVMWTITALELAGALRILTDPSFQDAFDLHQVHMLVKSKMAAGYDAYYVGLPFWGLASTLCSVLWLKSRYVPRGLALFGLLSSAWCVFCAFAFLMNPHFSEIVGASWFDVPMTVFELVLGGWLLFRRL